MICSAVISSPRGVVVRVVRAAAASRAFLADQQCHSFFRMICKCGSRLKFEPSQIGLYGFVSLRSLTSANLAEPVQNRTPLPTALSFSLSPSLPPCMAHHRKSTRLLCRECGSALAVCLSSRSHRSCDFDLTLALRAELTREALCRGHERRRQMANTTGIRWQDALP